MANKDAAFGFRPTRHLSGGDIRTEEFAIAANYGTAIYTGQVVEAVAGGGVEAAAAGDTQQAGVFGGVFYTDPSTSKPTFLLAMMQGTLLTMTPLNILWNFLILNAYSINNAMDSTNAVVPQYFFSPIIPPRPVLLLSIEIGLSVRFPMCRLFLRSIIAKSKWELSSRDS